MTAGTINPGVAATPQNLARAARRAQDARARRDALCGVTTCPDSRRGFLGWRRGPRLHSDYCLSLTRFIDSCAGYSGTGQLADDPDEVAVRNVRLVEGGRATPDDGSLPVAG